MELDKKPIEKIRDRAAQQRGLVTWDVCMDAGLTERQLAGFVARADFVRLRPRVYRLAGSPATWEQGLHAVLLSIGGLVGASHAAAAAMWQYRYAPDRRYEVTTSRSQNPEVEGVRVHRSRRFDDTDVITVDGILCTTFERTLCDLSAELSEFQLGRVLDDGLRRGVASLDRVRDCAERLESGPGRHMSSIRALLTVRDADYNPGGSASELRVLKVLRDAGLPPPVQQYCVTTGGKKYFLDLSWPELKVFGEYYGLPFHSGASAVAHDSRRLTALVANGWLPLVFTDESTDKEIVEQTTAALAQRQVDRLTYRTGA